MASSSEREAERQRRRERRRRARRARKALLAFLKRLRNACGSFQSVDDWLDYTQELAQLLVEHRDGLTQEQRERLERAMKQADLTLPGVNLACKALQGEIERVIAALPVGLLGLPAPVLIVLGLGAAAVIFGGAAWLGKTLFQSRAVSLTVVNEGCPPIALGEALTPDQRQALERIGVALPDSLPTDEQTALNLPSLPVMLTVDARNPGILLLTSGLPGAGELRLEIYLDPGVQTIELDGASIFGQQATVSLAQPEHHTLYIRCTAP